MEDYSKKFRKENKFIFEIRYSPKLELLDAKGKLIKEIHDNIKKRYPQWRINQSDVIFCDDLENPKDEYLIGLKRSAIIQQNIATFEDYLNNVYKLIKITYSYLKIETIKRMGFRIISTYTLDNIKSFDQALVKIEDTFLKIPINLGLKHKDLHIKIDHDNGFYKIGPVKKEEEWFLANFKDFKSSKNKFNYGYGFDIDSNTKDIEIKSENELLKQTKNVIELSKSIEDALIKTLEQ